MVHSIIIAAFAGSHKIGWLSGVFQATNMFEDIRKTEKPPMIVWECRFLKPILKTVRVAVHQSWERASVQQRRLAIQKLPQVS